MTEDERDDLYMIDPRHATIEGFKAILDILAKHHEDGQKWTYFCGAAHDVIYLYMDKESINPNSDDGLALTKLGCHYDKSCDSWAYFT